MTEPSQAVFLSYASQDARAAQGICEALRAAGIEVWFDQSELRGGDVWDHRIRREIRDCTLFIPVISANTAARREGYFRLEWDLADKRTQMMARDRVFIVPVCLDASSENGMDVPEAFQRAQWTRLSNAEILRAFIERVQRLLSPEPASSARTPARAQTERAANQPALAGAGWRRNPIALVAIVVAALGGLVYLAIEKPWNSKLTVASPSAASTAFNPPPHSVAVLPFINLSGDTEQEYFSEGLTEEILNSLIEINGLQVAGQTSAFSTQGKDAELGTIARKLNVSAILEGSVRRSGHTVRITAQLLNTVTGFHLWSKSYDRDLGDVLTLQTEIASAVAEALKVRLLGDEAAKIELGGTRSPAAFDAYLRGSKAFQLGQGLSSYQSAIAAFTEAVRLDPNYALAFAGRSEAYANYAAALATGNTVRELFDKSQQDAHEAIKLAPGLAEGYLALARFLDTGALDYAGASEAYQRAMTLAPGNAQVLSEGGRFAATVGRFDAGLAAARRGVALDPLSPRSHFLLGQALYLSRHYQEAVAAFGDVIRLEPAHQGAYGLLGLTYYALGNTQDARSSCESQPDHWASQLCLATVYEKLGQHADADSELQKMKTVNGDDAAYQYAAIYAQWGDVAKALAWLDTAMRVRDPALVQLKTDPLLDPLRKEPRFAAIERQLNFAG